MKETDVIIVGASFSGLACAATLKKLGIGYIIIEKSAAVVTPWRNHYERLHLHTNKGLSYLPYKKFDSSAPRYPSRLQVIEYAENYRKEFDINPVFNTEAKAIHFDGKYWTTETNDETYRSRFVIMATGSFGTPRKVEFAGMQTFPGKILHSSEYKTARDYTGKKVLVVGFGNSATEIGIDLYEQGAFPTLAVRSAVNIVPRDLLGIPILRISFIMAMLPPTVADSINDPLMRLLFGDITKLGLKRKPYGTFQQLQRDGTTPILDIGVIKHIRQGHISIKGDLRRIEGSTVHFEDGTKEDFDVIIAATGYDRNYAQIVHVDKSRFNDLKFSTRHQKLFGKDGLYFCGYWIGPYGVLNEINGDAMKIAGDIGRKVLR